MHFSFVYVNLVDWMHFNCCLPIDIIIKIKYTFSSIQHIIKCHWSSEWHQRAYLSLDHFVHSDNSQMILIVLVLSFYFFSSSTLNAPASILRPEELNRSAHDFNSIILIAYSFIYSSFMHSKWTRLGRAIHVCVRSLLSEAHLQTIT